MPSIVKDMNQTITGSWDPKYALDGDLQTKLMLHVGYSPLVSERPCGSPWAPGK